MYQKERSVLFTRQSWTKLSKTDRVFIHIILALVLGLLITTGHPVVVLTLWIMAIVAIAIWVVIIYQQSYWKQVDDSIDVHKPGERPSYTEKENHNG